MNWTLSELAAIAEILGLIAIVPSLIFVGIQLVRSNREARAAITQAIMESEINVAFKFAEHAGTWDKVVTGAPLSEGEELRRGIVLYNGLMTDTENRYHQTKAGYLHPKTWNASEASLPRVVGLPIFTHWRVSLGGLNCSADFLELLDKMAKETR